MARKKADVQAGGRDNILTTQEYVRKVNEDVSEDDHFMQGPWLQAIAYLHGEGVIVSGRLGDMKKHYIKGKLELVVEVVKSCTPNSLGDMTITLKDPTGIVYDVTSRHTQMRIIKSHKPASPGCDGIGVANLELAYTLASGFVN
nr:hypothetical protein [Tanacetum cinerariifolium]